MCALMEEEDKKKNEQPLDAVVDAYNNILHI